MQIQTRSRGTTFSVHDVEPVLTALPTRKTAYLLRVLLRDFDPKDAPESLYVSGYNSDSLEDTCRYHSLFSTIHLAFSQHRPLILSPDMVWITILQGFAQHVKNNSEELRPLLVNHTGKELLEIKKTETFVDSPEYDWESVIHEFASSLSERVGNNYSKLVSDFSTTGALERLVSEVALLDVFQSYFEYIMYCICGIPEITLEGNPDDWQRLKEKVELLQPYKLDWWLPHLREITDHFYRAATGDVDKEFWQDIYKQRRAYGWTRINGWIIKLVPYVRSGQTGDCIRPNPILKEDPAIWDDENKQGDMGGPGGIQTNDLPSGLSQVPFTILLTQTNETKQMQFLAGFLGAEQDTSTSALRPILGWAVREAPASASYLCNLPDSITKLPSQPAHNMKEIINKLLERDEEPRHGYVEIPGELFTFYKECDGLNYSARDSSWIIRSLTELEKMASLITIPPRPLNPDSFAPVKDSPSYNLFAAINEFVDKIRLIITPSYSFKKVQKKSLQKTEEIEVREREPRWLRFLDESDNSYMALELGNGFQVYRVDGKTGKAELAFKSFEICVRDFLDKARSTPGNGEPM